MDIKTVISTWFSHIIFKISSNELKSHFRKIESTSIKLIETEAHHHFNECSIINNLLPNYTDIYICISPCEVYVRKL